MGEAKRKREVYEAECMRRLHDEMERDEERRIDAIRFRWFCVGAGFAVVAMILIEIAFRQNGM